MTKPIKAYAAKSGKVLLHWTVSELKRDVKEKLFRLCNTRNWQTVKDAQYAIVQVEIREVEG